MTQTGERTFWLCRRPTSTNVNARQLKQLHRVKSADPNVCPALLSYAFLLPGMLLENIPTNYIVKQKRLEMFYQRLPVFDVDSGKSEHEEARVMEHSSPRLFAWSRTTVDCLLRSLSTLLASALCVLLIVDIFTRRQSTSHTGEMADLWAISRMYGNDENYMSLDHRYDYLWDKEMQANNSIIKLPLSGVEGEPRAGAIGMFHQLHCLVHIRKTLQRAREGEDIGIDEHDDDHWPHCFYYLRQAIFCSADDTIELPVVINQTRTGVIDGVQDVRKCRDSKHLYELRANDSIDARYRGERL